MSVEIFNNEYVSNFITQTTRIFTWMTLNSNIVSQFAFDKFLNVLTNLEFRSLPVRMFQQYLSSLHVIMTFLFVQVVEQSPIVNCKTNFSCDRDEPWARTDRHQIFFPSASNAWFTELFSSHLGALISTLKIKRKEKVLHFQLSRSDSWFPFLKRVIKYPVRQAYVMKSLQPSPPATTLLGPPTWSLFSTSSTASKSTPAFSWN